MAHCRPDELAPGHIRNFEQFAQRGDIAECWTWIGEHDRYGYATSQARRDGTRERTGAHRVAYLLTRGPIDAGLVLDHTCMNRWCVNPWHLEPVTNHENTIRQRRDGKCRADLHEMTPANTALSNGGQHRRCRACARTSNRRAKARSRSRAR